MKRVQLCVVSLSVVVFACAKKGPSGPEKAAAYNAEQERLAQEAETPTPATPASEEETTLQFPMCEVEKKPFFQEKTEGAAFRAIVYFNITDEGKTADHCYMRVEGAIKWEEKALGKVEEWTYPVEFAGQPRQRTVTYRLK